MAHGEHHATVHQAEVARVERDVDIGDALQQTVEEAGGPEFELGFALAVGTHGIDDFIALAPFFDHARDRLRRVLQIGVHHDHGVALGKVGPGGNGDLMAEVAAEIEILTRGSLRVQIEQQRERTVAAAVIDADQLPRLAGASMIWTTRR